MDVTQFIDPERLNDLGPGRPNQPLYEQLANLSPSDLFRETQVADRDMAACCLSALWLWNDFLDESHTISQSIETTSGSYWHGIMHRREPDYSNSKYWFRRVGQHEIFPSLAATARQLTEARDVSKAARFLLDNTDWDPFAFIDLCQLVARGKTHDELLCREIARAEWQLLFHHCYERARS
jgi:hypothetical protein